MQDLIRRARGGNPEAFVSLMEAHTQSLYKVARGYFQSPMNTEDAVLQTVLDCWDKLRTLRKPEYFKTWFTKILINNCDGILRRRANVVTLETVPEREGTEDNYGDMYFEELMSRLSPTIRTAMRLYYGEASIPERYPRFCIFLWNSYRPALTKLRYDPPGGR